MPTEMEDKLKKTVNKKHPKWTKKHKNAYIYGTMRKTGWKPKAADGMANASVQGQPQQAPPEQQAPPSSGISVTAVLTAEFNGTQQNIGTMKIQSPDDLKKLIKVVMQVFQQGQQPAQPEGQPQGQPAEQQPAQPQQ